MQTKWRRRWSGSSSFEGVGGGHVRFGRVIRRGRRGRKWVLVVVDGEHDRCDDLLVVKGKRALCCVAPCTTCAHAGRRCCWPFPALGEDALMADAGLRIKSILNFAFEAEPSLDADFQLESQLSLRHRRLKAVAFVTRAPPLCGKGIERASGSQSTSPMSLCMIHKIIQVLATGRGRQRYSSRSMHMPNGSVSLRPVVRQPRWSSLGVCLVHLCSRRLIVRTRSSLGRLRSCLSENLVGHLWAGLRWLTLFPLQA